MIPKRKICRSRNSFWFVIIGEPFFGQKVTISFLLFLKNVHFFPKGEVDDVVVLPLGLGEDEICEIHSLDAWRTVSSQSTNHFSFLHHKKGLFHLKIQCLPKLERSFLTSLALKKTLNLIWMKNFQFAKIEWLQKLILDTFPV